MTGPESGRRPSALIVGAGPAGLMAAERLALAGCSVAVYDRMPSVARKFLLAGRGGLNLCHSEPIERLLSRYGPARARLEPAIRAFPAEALREWCAALGAETFVGSSGRVFPKSMKSSPLLRAWLRRLEAQGVRFALRRRWVGFEGDESVFETPNGMERIRTDATVFALGGASWPRLGGDCAWTSAFEQAGIGLTPFAPANCGFRVSWSPLFRERFAGAPLKRLAMTLAGETARGEAVVTREGMEGGLIYALSRPLREAIERDGVARPTLDLRPDLTESELADRLSRPRGKRSASTHLAKTAGLSPAAVGLLREAGPLPQDSAALARLIKTSPLRFQSPNGIERAISSAGGVQFDEVDEGFMLRRLPGVFVVGEMLDWEAPTGGYLLHACLATGRLAGDAAAQRLRETA